MKNILKGSFKTDAFWRRAFARDVISAEEERERREGKEGGGETLNLIRYFEGII